ncbi:hypothetical protein [Vibrio marisflavi]|uniref:Uncharacterized protein n=1 Tax=Vibrio marisflavi CECT 7928 TaxID=634439 RepID=A0ABM8ZZZ5_9VIBR|nr:hypothetical protein [Vibrio marisflavi]CAH0536580.1 hypothetical protein VMF7928_00533 [Vibrio marisflavi CECT 7928]
MKTSALLKASSVLWMIWGVFHFAIGVAMIYLLSLGNHALSLSFVSSDPLMADLIREYAPVVTATLKQHSWNLGWFGVVTMVGSVYIWKRNATAIFVTALVGGLADLGYFMFVDLANLAPPAGTLMTVISASAIVLSFYAYYSSNRLQNQ